jgi:dihydrolipoamide dehydrogenase
VSTTNVDVLIIGTGPGGYHAAIRAAQLGQKVTVVERDRVGGVCLNWGCIPTKALLHAGELHRQASRGAEMGIVAKDVSVDLKALNSWKDGVVGKMTGGVTNLFKGSKITSVAGEASFTGSDTAEIRSKDGKTTYRFEHAIIATGAAPVQLDAFEVDQDQIMDSNGAVQLRRIPKRVLVIGGGAIGLEFATVYNRFGAEVTVVEFMDQILPGTDGEIVKALQRSMSKQGVKFHVKSKALGVAKRTKSSLVVEIETPEGKSKLDVDLVLVAVGRRPNTDGLEAGAAGVKLDEKGFVKVDAQRRTSNPKVYAIGDVVGNPMVAHKAMKEGIVAAEVIAGHKSAFDVLAIPNCVYTEPQVATVGLSEEEARKQGHDVRVGKFPLAASGRATTMGEPEGVVKVVGEAKTDRLLGLHIVGPAASDLVAEGALAIEMGATVEDVGLTVHPHPTLSESVMEAAENLHQRAIHIANR